MDEEVRLHSEDAERALLGCFLTRPELLGEITCDPLDLHIARHQWMMTELLHMKAAGKEIDILTLSAELGDRLGEVGGFAYLTRCVNDVPTTLHASEYAKTVRDFAERRKMMGLAGSIAKIAADGGGIGKVQQLIDAIARGASTDRDRLGADELHLLEFEGDRWWIEGVARSAGKSMLYAPPGQYKSLLALYSAIATVYGLAWLGRQTSPGPVVYWSGDMSKPDMQERLDDLTVGLGVPIPRGNQLLFDFSPLRLDEPNDVLAMANLVRSMRARVFILDSLYVALGNLDENASGDMGLAMSAVQQIIRGNPECSALILHHPTKNTIGELGSRLRGSGALLASLDSAYFIESVGPGDSVHILSRVKGRTKDLTLAVEFSFDEGDIGGTIVSHKETSRTGVADTFVEAGASAMYQGLRELSTPEKPWSRVRLGEYAAQNGIALSERTLQRACKMVERLTGVKVAKQGRTLYYWWAE